MSYVFANADCVVRWSGGIAHLHSNPPQVWEADHPLVRERPDLFVADPPNVIRAPGAEAPVEQATRRPGERRTTRRG